MAAKIIKPWSDNYHSAAFRSLVKSPIRLIHLLLFCAASASAADFQEELIQASSAFQPIQEQIGEQVEDGQFTQANQRLLNLFPKDKRTPVQTLALGNMLYPLDAKLSYALHKEAAQQLPHEPQVMLEWAMEQHRAGEYLGALAAYDEYSKAHPQFALFHGLAADCLIRLGKTHEASARWQQSEKAREGSLEALESVVCEVSRDPSLEQRRAELRGKAQQGDIDAAVQLIGLDGRYERDWWNNGPNRLHLKHDVPVLQKLPPNPRIKAALCLAECLMKEEPTREDIEAILNRDGYLIDPKKTLLPDAAILSLMLGTAVDAGVLKRAQARERFGEALRASAKTSKDSSLWNVIAYLYVDTDAMADIEEQAWKATNDPRFAAGYLAERLKQKSLKSNDPLWPKHCNSSRKIPGVLATAIAVNDPSGEELLVRGIKAEYRHFSSAPGFIMRPSARPLRMYFTQLSRLLEKQAKLKSGQNDAANGNPPVRSETNSTPSAAGSRR